MMRKILLARPSSLIVENMKKLMVGLNFTPVPLMSIEELDDHHPSEVAGIVISTALSSTVKCSYTEVIDRTKVLFRHKPCFLASYASVERTKKIVHARLQQLNQPLRAISIAEAAHLSMVDFFQTIIIITNDEIKEEPAFGYSSGVLAKVFQQVSSETSVHSHQIG